LVVVLNTENGHVFDVEILFHLWMQDMKQNYHSDQKVWWMLLPIQQKGGDLQYRKRRVKP